MTVAGRQIERSAREAGLVDWRRVEDIAIARLRRAPGRADRGRARGDRRGLCAAAMARVVPALAAAPRHGPAGRRGARRRRGPRRLGRGQHVGLRRAHRPARGRRCSTRCCPRGAGSPRRDDAGQPLGHDAPARPAARASWASACSASTTSRCCSAETTPGRLLFVEENIRQTARAMDVPARPVPDLDRAPRDDPRLRVRGASLAPAVPRRAPRAPARRCSATTPRPWAGTRSGPSARRSAATGGATTSTGWSG